MRSLALVVFIGPFVGCDARMNPLEDRSPSFSFNEVERSIAYFAPDETAKRPWPYTLTGMSPTGNDRSWQTVRLRKNGEGSAFATGLEMKCSDGDNGQVEVSFRLLGKPTFSGFSVQNIGQVVAATIATDDVRPAREFGGWKLTNILLAIDWPTHERESVLSLKLIPAEKPAKKS